jgi:hypothetical protein
VQWAKRSDPAFIQRSLKSVAANELKAPGATRMARIFGAAGGSAATVATAQPRSFEEGGREAKLLRLAKFVECGRSGIYSHVLHATSAIFALHFDRLLEALGEIGAIDAQMQSLDLLDHQAAQSRDRRIQCV